MFMSFFFVFFQTLNFSSLYDKEKNNFVKKIEVYYTLWKYFFKVIPVILSDTEILWIKKIMIKLNCSIFMSSNKSIFYELLFHIYKNA